MVPSLPLLSCELSMSVKENPDRKKKNNNEPSLKLEVEFSVVEFERGHGRVLRRGVFHGGVFCGRIFVGGIIRTPLY